MADQRRAPLFEAIAEHLRNRPVRFHVPGHKGGRGLEREAAAFFQDVMEIDLTELAGLDDLHAPGGAILEAEKLAAECFGAEETLFLVNGSTVGNLALILSLCRRGDLLLVQRNVHKSVIHGLMLAGAKAVFLPVQRDEKTGLPGAVRVRDVEAALRAYPEAKGIFLTNPNYYGAGTDLCVIAELAHAHGKPLLVDEAHGAHYGFHPEVPPSALSCGADGVVQSTHKMLDALTMGAMLHLKGPLLDREAVRQRLHMLQTSSPSYPILASLDLARRRMALSGKDYLEQGLRTVRTLVSALGDFPWLEKAELTPETKAFSTLDPFKVAIRDRTGTLDGYRLQRELERRYCYAEMADSAYVLLALSPAVAEEDAGRLRRALEEIGKEYGLSQKEAADFSAGSALALPDWDAVSSPVQFDIPLAVGQGISIPLQKAEGFRSAEMIVPYPPGIPFLYPGEVITEGVVDALTRLAAMGAHFQGAKDPRLASIRVFPSVPS